MKKIYFILILVISFSANAKIIEFIDSDFKAALIYTGVDQNDDGEISTGEALSVISLEFYWHSSISDMSEIGYFENMTSLNCAQNQLTTLDLSNNKALKKLDCKSNRLTTLILPQNSVLSSLNCSDNELTILDITQNTFLEKLVCDGNDLYSINNPRGKPTRY